MPEASSKPVVAIAHPTHQMNGRSMTSSSRLDFHGLQNSGVETVEELQAAHCSDDTRQS